ncbi:MAG: asparagine synthase (glutamine-hydrolyzing) [Ignavibacteria bacterium]|nr:asparagine synthase (glutamine-hydrolyzing) [Ignavibacteria bacterium]
MCGIAGLIVKNIENYDFTKFKNSTKLMSHRGPDNFGEYYDKNVALFHYRLSILDLDKRSNQPFFNEASDKTIVYNGEIYNYKDLAHQYNFNLHTTSDTEVILKTIDAKGMNSLPEWNGIFAFALHDKKNNSVTLARDRFGVKPLYVYENDSFIAFASEAKVILNWLDSFSINLQCLSEYIWYGNTLSNPTLINNLNKLSPGSYTTIELNSFTSEKKEFWTISSKIRPNTEDSFETSVTKTRSLLENAVKTQLVSDVPIGIFLSGGIDSSAITAFASKYVSGKLNTYSVEYDFNVGQGSELAKAKLIAKKFNTNHHELKVESNNIIEDFESLVYQYDEPFADSANFPLYLLAKQCKNDMTVVLQGDGGDELFAGYRRYKLLGNLMLWKYNSIILSKILPDKFLRYRAKRMAFTLQQESDALRMALLMTQTTPGDMPDKIFNSEIQKKLLHQSPFKTYEEKNEQFVNEDLAQRMLYTDFEILLPHTYLEKVDKATMLMSIEARVPFLDNNLTDYVLSLPAKYKIKRGINKYLLKKSLNGIIPNEILNAPKQGFNTPTGTWLQTSLYEYAKSKFSSLSDNGFLNKNYLLELLDEHRNKVKNHNMILWRALVLVAWLDIYKNKLIFE